MIYITKKSLQMTIKMYIDFTDILWENLMFRNTYKPVLYLILLLCTLLLYAVLMILNMRSEWGRSEQTVQTWNRLPLSAQCDQSLYKLWFKLHFGILLYDKPQY